MKKIKRRKSDKSPDAPLVREDKAYYLSQYQVTDEPIKSQKDKLPKFVSVQLEEIYYLVSSDPKLALTKLLPLKEQYPHVPTLYNYLVVAYTKLGNKTAAKEISLENYAKNPNYLFAKINYAQICLHEGKFEQIPIIFDNKFDLKLLYPTRNLFHVSEFAGLTGVICAYFSAIGERKTAELLYKSLLEVTPDSEMVILAKRFLYPSLLRRLMVWAKKTQNKTSLREETSTIETQEEQKKTDGFNLEA